MLILEEFRRKQKLYNAAKRSNTDGTKYSMGKNIVQQGCRACAVIAYLHVSKWRPYMELYGENIKNQI